MFRSDLLAKLKIVSGALAAKDLIPVFSCFCFTGQDVFAWDDSVALVTPLKTSFKGAVRGSILLDWLTSLTAKEIEPSEEGGNLVFKAGRAKLTLASVPEKEWKFKSPKLKDDVLKLGLSDPVLKMMKRVAITLGTDPGHPWRLGLTLTFVKGRLVAYTSDNLRASRASSKLKYPKELEGKTIQLPPRFTGLLLEMAAKDTLLYVGKSWFSASLPDGVRLFSRKPQEVDTTMMPTLFAQAKENNKTAVLLPKKWHGMMTRALILLKGSAQPVSALKIADNELFLTTESKFGDGKEFEKLKGEHENVICHLAPELVVPFEGLAERFMIEDGQRIWFFGTDYCCMASLGVE